MKTAFLSLALVLASGCSTTDMNATVEARVTGRLASNATATANAESSIAEASDELWQLEVERVESLANALESKQGQPFLFHSLGADIFGNSILSGEDNGPGLFAIQSNLQVMTVPESMKPVQAGLLQAVALEIAAVGQWVEESGAESPNLYTVDPRITPVNVDDFASQVAFPSSFERSLWVKAQRLRRDTYQKWEVALAEVGLTNRLVYSQLGY
jgi:hypothetical protein